ncbi:kinase-like domain-containing protein [Biscogniauxia marginata]|nr:kinase-like domain-containing protein [Biscogniauxia marginata]
MAQPDGVETTAPPPFAPPLPQILSRDPSTPSALITQGAEARLYKTSYVLPTIACALKYRPPKPWRHPALDARLTRHRILAEARILAKCRREGVRVPAVYAVDEAAGWLAMEWIGGAPVRVGINAWLARGGRGNRREGKGEEEEKEGGKDAAAAEDDVELVALLRRIALAVGGLHRVGIVHGDLTTSNMMLRPLYNQKQQRQSVNGSHNDSSSSSSESGKLDGEIVIIDFGLASQSTSDEDRAVDLYVLERAFASTHPRAEALFTRVLEGSYKDAFRQAPVVLRKLEEVRMRGRKRSMIG